jgi:multiple sugar transport system permease protein
MGPAGGSLLLAPWRLGGDMTRSERSVGRTMQPYFWLAPIAGIMVFFWIFPWVWTLLSSFKDYSMLRPGDVTFVGLRNYGAILFGEYFLDSLLRTLVLIVLNTVLTTALALAIATALTDPRIRFRKGFQIICLLPGMLTPVAVGIMWRLILWTDWGVVQYLLRSIGLPKINFFGRPELTMPIVVFMSVWRAYPFDMLILYAALLTVPRDHIEAASIDGASALQVFFRIRVPWIWSSLTVVMFFRVVFSLRSFDMVWSLYNGTSGPIGSGRILGVYLYEHFHLTRHIGENSAFAYILLFLSLVLGVSLVKMLSREGGAV